MSSVHFFTADKGYPLKEKRKIKKWISSEISSFGKEIGEINIIFCSDNYLLEINQKFLNHNYFTDVITFDNSIENRVSGEIYLSVDRIKENAKEAKSTLFKEYLRIIIHGILHLLSYTDKTKEERDQMTEKENQTIEKFYQLH